jgi:hypothetical protein
MKGPRRMKKPSYEELKQRVETLERKNDLLSFYLYDSGKGEDRLKTWPQYSEDGRYVAELFRPLSGTGGYVVIRSLKDGAVPTIVYLDEIDAKWPVEFRILADRLRVIRQRIFDEEKQAVCNSKR